MLTTLGHLLNLDLDLVFVDTTSTYLELDVPNELACSTTAKSEIRAHVQLCWLAPLLTLVLANATGDTWRNTRRELGRMHVVTLATGDWASWRF